MKQFVPHYAFVAAALLFAGCERASKVHADVENAGPKWEEIFGKPTRAKVQAKQNFADGFFGAPNRSGGTYIGQMTVSIEKTRGFTSGRSQGAIAVFREQDEDAFVKYTLAAVYDEPSSGLVATASSYQSGLPPEILTLGSVPFADTPAVDLRIQQTDTQLILSARPTALSGATPGPWSTVATVSALPTENRDRLLAGISNVDKGGYFYFSDLRLDGPGIGGAMEHPIIANCEAAADAIRDAQTKLAADPQDLTGATASLQTAADQTQAAITTLSDPGVVQNLQSTTNADGALVLLKAASQKIAAAQAAITSGKAAKIRLQQSALKVAGGAEEGAIANLIGLPAPNLKKLPEAFTWHVD